MVWLSPAERAGNCTAAYFTGRNRRRYDVKKRCTGPRGPVNFARTTESASVSDARVPGAANTTRSRAAAHVEEATAIQIFFSNANPSTNPCALRAYKDYLGVWGAGAPLPVTLRDPGFPEHRRTGDAETDVGLLSDAIAHNVKEALLSNQPSLMVGGICVHLTGQIPGVHAVYGAGVRVGLAFIDAHGDINTPFTTISGSLDGMPVAVALGLAWPSWRSHAGMAAPLAADQVFILDGRDLDPGEVTTIFTANITIASAPGFPGAPDKRLRDAAVAVEAAVAEMASNVDVIYMHIDGDVMDESLVLHHRLAGPGPDLAQMRHAIDVVMRTRMVAAACLVSIQCTDPATDIDPRSGVSVIRNILDGWKEYGMPSLAQPH